MTILGGLILMQDLSVIAYYRRLRLGCIIIHTVLVHRSKGAWMSSLLNWQTLRSLRRPKENKLRTPWLCRQAHDDAGQYMAFYMHVILGVHGAEVFQVFHRIWSGQNCSPTMTGSTVPRIESAYVSFDFPTTPDG